MPIFSYGVGLEELLEDKTTMKECNEKQYASKTYYSFLNFTYSNGQNDMIIGKTISIFWKTEYV